MVEHQVALFRGNLEQKIFGLKRLVAELKEEIEKLNAKIADVNVENFQVKQALAKESELIQSFKDPEGMSGFRLVLQDMESDIKFLSNEKKSQYERMK